MACRYLRAGGKASVVRSSRIPVGLGKEIIDAHPCAGSVSGFLLRACFNEFTMTPAAPGARRFPDRAWRCRCSVLQASRYGIAPCECIQRYSCPAHTLQVYDELKAGSNSPAGMLGCTIRPSALRCRTDRRSAALPKPPFNDNELVQWSWGLVLTAWVYDDTHEVAMARYPWNWPPLGRWVAPLPAA